MSERSLAARLFYDTHNNWIDITCVNDNFMTYFCTVTGKYKFVPYYVEVDNQRAGPDPEVLRQLGHYLEDV